MKMVVIRARNRQEARKKVLDFWLSHREQLPGNIRDFLRRCSTDATGRVIMYKE